MRVSLFGRRVEMERSVMDEEMVEGVLKRMVWVGNGNGRRQVNGTDAAAPIPDSAPPVDATPSPASVPTSATLPAAAPSDPPVQAAGVGNAAASSSSITTTSISTPDATPLPPTTTSSQAEAALPTTPSATSSIVAPPAIVPPIEAAAPPSTLLPTSTTTSIPQASTPLPITSTTTAAAQAPPSPLAAAPPNPASPPANGPAAPSGAPLTPPNPPKGPKGSAPTSTATSTSVSTAIATVSPSPSVPAPGAQSSTSVSATNAPPSTLITSTLTSATALADSIPDPTSTVTMVMSTSMGGGTTTIGGITVSTGGVDGANVAAADGTKETANKVTVVVSVVFIIIGSLALFTSIIFIIRRSLRQRRLRHADSPPSSPSFAPSSLSSSDYDTSNTLPSGIARSMSERSAEEKGFRWNNGSETYGGSTFNGGLMKEMGLGMGGGGVGMGMGMGMGGGVNGEGGQGRSLTPVSTSMVPRPLNLGATTMDGPLKLPTYVPASQRVATPTRELDGNDMVQEEGWMKDEKREDGGSNAGADGNASENVGVNGGEWSLFPKDVEGDKRLGPPQYF